MRRILSLVALGMAASAGCGGESRSDFNDRSGSGGAVATGGSTTGGSTTGGAGTGGTTTGGSTTSGTSSGGSTSGGSTSGGATTGGSPAGGTDSGTGGSTAGSPVGGSPSGASGLGGVAGTGGSLMAGSGGVVLGECTSMGNDCPPGYTCFCGGPGVGRCSCHKQCTRDEECGTEGYTCGCTPDDAPSYCVNLCDCTCD